MAFIEVKYKDFVYYEIEEFNDTELVKYFFTTRIGFSHEEFLKNISEIMNVPIKNIITLKQVHGKDLLNMYNTDKLKFAQENIMEADGIITNIKDLVILTFHADCVPVAFVDKSKKVIAVSHAGWKGTLENISGNTVEKMVEKYNSNPKDILVGISPSIGCCCYEVGKEVYEKFNEEYNFIENIFKIKNNKIYLDLWKTNELQLLNKGILKENIYISNLCTSCNNNIFYSYRKEKGINRRMASVMKLQV